MRSLRGNRQPPTESDGASVGQLTDKLVAKRGSLKLVKLTAQVIGNPVLKSSRVLDKCVETIDHPSPTWDEKIVHSSRKFEGEVHHERQ